MAKNLKLNIKNAQLAEALKLNKKRKEPEIESNPTQAKSSPVASNPVHTEVASPTVSSHIENNSADAASTPTRAKSQMKNRVLAKAAGSKPTKPEEPDAPIFPKRKSTKLPSHYQDSLNAKTKEKESEPFIQEVVEPEIPVVAAPIEIQKEATPKEKESSLKPPASIEEDKKLAKKMIKNSLGELDDGVEKKAAFPPKDFRDPKALKPRFDAKKTFDARDRQGLRDNEEGSWRKKKPSKFKMRSEELIIRPKVLTVRLPITVKDLASEMKLKASELIAKIFLQGVTITINDILDDETIVQLLGSEFDCNITIDTKEEERLRITDKTISEEILSSSSDNLQSRPPVIAFMGHVDHGKTSLIDAIRKSNRVASEAGAITQHIGAFQCQTDRGTITILDTPGHEAFFEMRKRGATVTDIVILVIAGDQGMMRQTEEALEQAREAGVPIIVAINKCDKPSFDTEKVYRQLADHDLLPEAWGGAVITVNCSAVTKEGVSTLLEMILLQAEIMELQANPDTRARGTVLESEMHKGMGPVATVLVQNGTLKLGDALVFDQIYGRVKTMYNEYGHTLSVAPPSTPVKVTGISGLPDAGCEFIVVGSEKEAKSLCEGRAAGHKRAALTHRAPGELENILVKKQALSEKKHLNLILKADVQGSLEALKNLILKLPMDKVEVHIVSADVGEISESDVELAIASQSAVVGFHTRIESHAEQLISNHQVIVRQHDVIYHLITDIKKIMASKLDKIRKETEVGSMLIKALFRASQLGVICGGIVTNGTIKRNHHVKLFRNEQQVWEGAIASLKRVKEDVREVTKGVECGVLLTNFNDAAENDILKSYEITYLEQEL